MMSEPVADPPADRPRAAVRDPGAALHRPGPQPALRRPRPTPPRRCGCARPLADQQQYARNAEDGARLAGPDRRHPRPRLTDQVRRARELALQGANAGRWAGQAREALAVEVDQIREGLRRHRQHDLPRPPGLRRDVTAGAAASRRRRGTFVGDAGAVNAHRRRRASWSTSTLAGPGRLRPRRRHRLRRPDRAVHRAARRRRGRDPHRSRRARAPTATGSSRRAPTSAPGRVRVEQAAARGRRRRADAHQLARPRSRTPTCPGDGGAADAGGGLPGRPGRDRAGAAAEPAWTSCDDRRDLGPRPTARRSALPEIPVIELVQPMPGFPDLAPLRAGAARRGRGAVQPDLARAARPAVPGRAAR